MARWVLVLLSLALPPRSSEAGSYFLTRPADSLQIVDQSAIVVFADGWEELSLAAQLVGPRRSFAWLIPVPSAPQVRAMPTGAFEALSATDCRFMTPGAYPGSGCPPQVTRRSQPQGFPYQSVQLLRSKDELAFWARDHFVDLPSPVLDDFTLGLSDSSWVVAVNYVARPQRPGSVLPDTIVVGPLRMRFRADEPVCPIVVDWTGRSSPETRLYVLAKSFQVPDTEWPDWCIDLRDSVSLPGSVHFPSGSFIRGTVSLPAVADPDSHFVGLPEPPRLLTRATASLARCLRNGVRFRAYDPVVELRHPELMRRAVAATVIGREHTEGGFEALEAFLATSPKPDEDVFSALWAAGQLADSRSGRVLEPWARHEDPKCRLKALSAFEVCGAREGLAAAIDHLIDPRWTAGIKDGGLRINLDRTAIRLVCEYEDSSVIPVLRASVARHDARKAWLSDCDSVPDRSLDRFGVRSLVALAGLGEPEATETLLEGMRCGARATADERLKILIQRDAGHDQFTWDRFWLFAGINAPMGQNGWRGVNSFLWDSRTVDRLQRKLLENLISDPGTPDCGKLYLIASLPGRSQSDFDTVEAIWHRALRDRLTEVEVDLWLMGDIYQRARLNLTALGCIQLLERFAREGQLARLLPAAAADPNLAAEVALALAHMKNEAGLAYCEATVAKKWARLAGTEEYRNIVERLVASREPPIWVLLIAFEQTRYSFGFAYCLKSHRGMDYLRERMTDRTTPDLLRLMWISLAVTPEELALARRMLWRFKAEGISDPLVRKVYDRI